MSDHSSPFAYSATPPVYVAILDNGIGLHQSILLPTLRDSGFHAEKVASATELYRAISTRPIAIAVLDTHLTGESGYVVAEHLRSISGAGIVMQTCPNSPQECIRAYRSGADLCLPKPIDMDLFIATLQGLVRRLNSPATIRAVADSPATLGWQLRHDGWELISPRGQVVVMTAGEQWILKTLAEKIGQPVSRAALIEVGARDVDDFDPHRLEMAISRLRAKVRKSTGEELPLKTVRGKGYSPDYNVQGEAAVFMEYWLIGYGYNPCPVGWFSDGYGDCVRNSNYVAAPDVPITALGSLALTGTATAASNDTITFSYGTDAYSLSAKDSVVYLSTIWNQSEFNVVGNAGGSQAVFNSGSAITVNVAANYGGTAKPSCVANAGTTGESNNLNLGSCSAFGGASPYIQFSESN